MKFEHYSNKGIQSIGHSNEIFCTTEELQQEYPFLFDLLRASKNRTYSIIYRAILNISNNPTEAQLDKKSNELPWIRLTVKEIREQTIRDTGKYTIKEGKIQTAMKFFHKVGLITMDTYKPKMDSAERYSYRVHDLTSRADIIESCLKDWNSTGLPFFKAGADKQIMEGYFYFDFGIVYESISKDYPKIPGNHKKKILVDKTRIPGELNKFVQCQINEFGHCYESDLLCYFTEKYIGCDYSQATDNTRKHWNYHFSKFIPDLLEHFDRRKATEKEISEGIRATTLLVPKGNKSVTHPERPFPLIANHEANMVLQSNGYITPEEKAVRLYVSPTSKERYSHVRSAIKEEYFFTDSLKLFSIRKKVTITKKGKTKIDYKIRECKAHGGSSVYLFRGWPDPIAFWGYKFNVLLFASNERITVESDKFLRTSSVYRKPWKKFISDLVVHHENEDRDCNDLSNLYLMTHSEHRLRHKSKKGIESFNFLSSEAPEDNE